MRWGDLYQPRIEVSYECIEGDENSIPFLIDSINCRVLQYNEIGSKRQGNRSSL
jgi:hypothetical protein